MARKRITAYWLLLMMVLLMASMTLSVGETQARYQNTTVLTTVVAPEGSPVTSDCLVSEGKQTILLGELPMGAVTTVSFTVEAVRDVSAQLSWTNDHADYLSVALGEVKIEGEGENPGQLTQDNLLELTQGTKATIQLTLTPTEAAMATDHDRLEVNVEVVLGDVLGGTFRASLPAVEIPDVEETEPTQPPQQEGGETGDPTGDGTGSENEAGTGETDDTGNSEDTGDTGDSGIVPAAVSEEASEPAQEAVAVFEDEGEDESAVPAAQAETGDGIQTASDEVESTAAPTTEPTSEPTAVPTTEPTMAPTTEPATAPATQPTTAPTTAPTTDPPVDDGDETLKIQMGTISSFDPTSMLPISITPAEKNSLVVIGLGEGEAAADADSAITMTELPAFTRYSLDGENYFLLYYGGFVEIDNPDGTQQSLLLDVSRVTDTELILMVQEHLDGELAGTCTIGTKAETAVSGPAESVFLTEKTTSFTIELPLSWIDNSLELEYGVQMLSADGNGGIAYVPVADEILVTAYVHDAQTSMHALTVSFGETLPPAGTYRLNMNWTYEGICFEQTQMTFFINYSETV